MVSLVRKSNKSSGFEEEEEEEEEATGIWLNAWNKSVENLWLECGSRRLVRTPLDLYGLCSVTLLSA
ncbi:hypothetical protein KOW79_016376 [Hemibagrus wyckioides]|uniref:Uncharacterized protein n=1 Tax=Hemibagrus wyckioides TaxID=337641 RepID=A0A9D3SID0_9TELE|nr:hypothetical protein KOW79_016376 [Hemibagrus wyckioides]